MKGLAASLLAGMAVFGSACCITFADQAMSLVAETALVVWDDQAKVEHFVRKASFAGGADDFGFILPVPNQPFAIEVANEDVFGFLESSKPRENSGIGCGREVSDAAATAAAGVEVLDEKKVGDYRSTVLRATDGGALSAWLKAKGHEMRPAMTPWLEHYTKKGWVFVAFQYKGGAQVKTKAVRVSFKANEPHYPYKMPSDTWEAGHYRPLDLFVVSSKEMAGEFTNGQTWKADRPWSTEIAETSRLEHLLSTEANSVALPPKMVLTRFKNTSAANDYEYDLTFKPAPDKTVAYATAGAFFVVAVAFVRKRLSRGIPSKL